MNVHSACEILKKRFDSVELMDKTIKCKNQYSVHVFDFSQSVLSETFDVDKFQAQIISNDYYESENELQWNFYLSFIVEDDKYADFVNAKQVAKIENNPSYSRKKVISETQFSEIFEPRSIANPIERDYDRIADRWLTELRSASLACVFSTAKDVTNSVRDYVDGNPYTEASEAMPSGSSSSGDSNVSMITDIEIRKFRKAPPPKSYSFGLVNLITGANGRGKTSLFEAIEAALCGQNFRSELRPTEVDIEIGFKNIARRDRVLSQNARYRGRDLKWYGRNYPTGNNLSFGFNRFNFHDADAPFRLSNPTVLKKSDFGIYDALLKIALGEQVNIIADRAVRFKVEFQKIASEQARALVRLSADLAAETQIKSLHAIRPESELVLEALESAFLKLGFKRLNQDVGEIVAHLTRGSVAIAQIRNSCRWLSDGSYEGLKKEKQTLLTTILKVETLQAEVGIIDESLASLRKTSTDARERRRLLDQALKYFSEPEVLKIKSLEDSSKRLTAIVEKIRTTLSNLRKIGIKYSILSETLPGALSKTKASEADISKRLAENDRELQSITLGATNLDRILSQIRALGRELKDLPHVPDDCPLCSTKLTAVDFRNRLVAIAMSNVSSNANHSELIEAHRKNAELRQAAQAVAEKLKDITALRDWLQSMPSYNTEIDNLKIEAFDLKLEASLNQTEKKQEELKTLARQFESLELKAIDFVKIESQLGILFPEIVASDKVYQALELKIAEMESLQQITQIQLEASTQGHQLKQSELDQVYAKYFDGNVAGVDLGTEVRKRRESVEDGILKLDELAGVFHKIRTLKLSQAESELTGAEVIAGKIKANADEDARASAILAQADRRIHEMNNEVTACKTKSQYCERALEALNKILVTDSKDKALAEFIASNSAEISKIFVKIHSPHEFSSLALVGQEVFLERRGGDGTKANLSEISTGQRAALAMSIFLVLNSHLTDGPPVIMIDDPIAQVDDLNLLSFLDHLRDLAVAGERQIFFATANPKIAGFFRKKFWFLGHDKFREIHFESKD